jgi:hypothetical protein
VADPAVHDCGSRFDSGDRNKADAKRLPYNQSRHTARSTIRINREQKAGQRRFGASAVRVSGASTEGTAAGSWPFTAHWDRFDLWPRA